MMYLNVLYLPCTITTAMPTGRANIAPLQRGAYGIIRAQGTGCSVRFTGRHCKPPSRWQAGGNAKASGLSATRYWREQPGDGLASTGHHANIAPLHRGAYGIITAERGTAT
jgi:hypothetical protein